MLIETFDKIQHDRNSFDCGNSELNKYFKEVARKDVLHGFTQAYVVTDEDTHPQRKYMGILP